MVVFVAGIPGGVWRIERNEPVRGEGLPSASRLTVFEDWVYAARGAWALRGVTSNERYVNAAEQAELGKRSPALGRREATRAALIPIRKTDEWWALAQGERRAIIEERSHHIATGLRYLPAVARRLYHGRDLGEPFDFLTWFEFAPEHEAAFEELVLRETEEWSYVEREVDLRLAREG